MNRPSPLRLARTLPWSALAILALIAGCGSSKSVTKAGPVPSGAFAVVGARALELAVLRRAVGSRPIERASGELIEDTRVALESSALHPELAAVIERGALARGLIESLRARSLSKAPPREDELAAAASDLWAELDRPRCVRTVNIMAHVPELADGQAEERLLRRIAEEVRGSPTPEELNRRVLAVEKDGVEVIVVLVAPVAEDGRLYAETPADAGSVVPPVEYARAAAKLTHVGETSDVVATPAGFHVLMALDIVPPYVAPAEERRLRLEQAVADRRIEPELVSLRSELAARAAVWQSPHQATLTSLVWRAHSGQ